MAFKLKEYSTEEKFGKHLITMKATLWIRRYKQELGSYFCF